MCRLEGRKGYMKLLTSRIIIIKVTVLKEWIELKIKLIYSLGIDQINL